MRMLLDNSGEQRHCKSYIDDSAGRARGAGSWD